VTETNVFQLSQPGCFIDPLTEVLRDGARALLAQAVEAEVATLLSRYAGETSNDGRQRLVRHGHLPEREIMTALVLSPCAVRGCATVSVKAPSAFAFRRRSFLPTRADRRASKC
jgi:putative transposase